MQSPIRKSAAGIVFRKKAEPPSSLFERLRALIAIAAGNKHSQAIVAIQGCILEGLDTAPRIIGALRQLGFNAQHAGMLLNEGTGDDVERHRWARDEEGRYSLLG